MQVWRLIQNVLVLLALLLALPAIAAIPDLETGFHNPPESTKPWVYWYWISDNISKEGITRDLEAMARVGIGEALIGNVDVVPGSRGPVKVLSQEWWGMVEHAIREGKRLGVNIGMFNCPGWSQSGGPWVKPEQAMRYLAISETHVHGPQQFNAKLPAPHDSFQDVAVLAFPAPQHDTDTLAQHAPQVTCTPALKDSSKLFDGRLDTVCDFSGNAAAQSPLTVDVQLAEPFTARSLVLHPAHTAFVVQCELQAKDADGQFKSVRKFTLDRHNVGAAVGFLPYGPVAVAFPPVTAREFRFVFTGRRNAGGLAEIELSGAARLEKYVEKQLGKMFQDPQPLWDAYLWPSQPEIDSPQLAVSATRVLNLSRQLAADGTLRWDAPAGDWVVLRLGMTPTGTQNGPASPEATGLEIDKMNRQAIEYHFNAYIGQLLERMPAADRRAFRHVVADSYEMGSQNWTDGFGELFRKTYGYDPLPWLPVLTGRIVGSAEQSDRFLWDLRRLVADRISYDYVGGLRELSEQHGLQLWLENYGHWGFPGEFLQYGGQSDRVSGEFWATGDLGSIELRAASSAAHIYGMPTVSAEAFTSGGPHWVMTPWWQKQRGDWSLTEGINHYVLHVFIHQPDERRPGVNAWFGTEFNRHNTWFHQMGAWIDYVRRADFLLQQGKHVADVAYFIGEDTPKMTGTRQPPLPAGRDFDYINAEVIENRLAVKDGQFVLPDGMAYRVLVLPKLDTMRPELLKKIRDLVAAGGTILGPRPTRSPSLQNYPACDDAVKRLAAEVWGQCDGSNVQQVRFGQGRVFCGVDLSTVFNELKLPPDVQGIDPKKVLWTHRATADADIYFLSSQSEQPVTIAPVFRVKGKAPELWEPDSGRVRQLVAFEPVNGGVRVPLAMDARGSVFVAFREAVSQAPVVTQVTRNGKVILTTAAPAVEASATGSQMAAGTFTMAGWLEPAIDIAFPKEADSGVFLHLARNDAIFPPHGDSLFPEGGHAGAGISAGRNGDRRLRTLRQLLRPAAGVRRVVDQLDPRRRGVPKRATEPLSQRQNGAPGIAEPIPGPFRRGGGASQSQWPLPRGERRVPGVRPRAYGGRHRQTGQDTASVCDRFAAADHRINPPRQWRA